MMLRRATGFTQAELAARAGTSQPAIAAYESGRTSPTLRTLARLAHAGGLEVAVEFVNPMTREDRRSLAWHDAIATKVIADPEAAFRRARRNVAKMLEVNPHAAPLLHEWRRLLRGTTNEVLTVFADCSERGRELRAVTPFAGLLSASERSEVIDRFRREEAHRGS